MTKKFTTKKETIQKVKTLEEIFSEQWLSGVKDGFEQLEKLDLDKPDKTFLKGFKMMFFFRAVTYLTLEYMPKEQLTGIFHDTETVCNRVGTSLIEDGMTVNKCVTRTHKECAGSYVNKVVNRTIICKCSCHKKE